MKKILVLFALAVLIFSAVFVAAAVATSYNSSTGAVQMTLQKGWNMIPVGSPPKCPNNSVKASYLYSPVQNSYLGAYKTVIGTDVFVPVNAQSIVESEQASLYYHAIAPNGGVFVYTSEQCSFEANIGTAEIAEFIWTVKQGWNFLAVTPWMVGDNLKNIFADCTVLAANNWDEVNQKWLSPSSTEAASRVSEGTDEIENKHVGNVLVVKIGSDCKLRVGGTPLVPPPLE